LKSPRHEKYAQELVINLASLMPRGKAKHQAALAAGFTGSAVADNARRLAQRDDLKARMRELADAPGVGIM
jgi:hypothetical protein